MNCDLEMPWINMNQFPVCILSWEDVGTLSQKQQSEIFQTASPVLCGSGNGILVQPTLQESEGVKLLLRIDNGKFTKKPIEFRTNQKEVYQQEARVFLMYVDVRLIMSHHLRMFHGHTMFTTFLWATTGSTAIPYVWSCLLGAKSQGLQLYKLGLGFADLPFELFHLKRTDVSRKWFQMISGISKHLMFAKGCNHLRSGQDAAIKCGQKHVFLFKKNNQRTSKKTKNCLKKLEMDRALTSLFEGCSLPQPKKHHQIMDWRFKSHAIISCECQKSACHRVEKISQRFDYFDSRNSAKWLRSLLFLSEFLELPLLLGWSITLACCLHVAFKGVWKLNRFRAGWIHENTWRHEAWCLPR